MQHWFRSKCLQDIVCGLLLTSNNWNYFFSFVCSCFLISSIPWQSEAFHVLFLYIQIKFKLIRLILLILENIAFQSLEMEENDRYVFFFLQYLQCKFRWNFILRCGLLTEGERSYLLFHYQTFLFFGNKILKCPPNCLLDGH